MDEFTGEAASLGLRHVFFAGRYPREAALATLSDVDVIWVGLRNEPLFRFGIGMNKIFDAMVAGRPVVGSYTAGNDPIAEAGCGVRVPAEDVAALTEALEAMRARSAAERDLLGQAGAAFVRREHDYAVIAQRFLATMEAARADPNPHRRRSGLVRTAPSSSHA
jgi:glycosyltransferase involved in cell wall biosynthesis